MTRLSPTTEMLPEDLREDEANTAMYPVTEEHIMDLCVYILRFRVVVS